MNPWIKAGWPLKSVETRWITPGVSILQESGNIRTDRWGEYSRLALEVLHYVEESVIHIGLVDKAHLNLVKVAQRILRIYQ